jgi:lipoprotein Spr/probable lipoprotein NlpC
MMIFLGCSTKANKNYTFYNEDNSAILKNLLAHYQQWKGARYRLGGLSKSGVDCSGFVYLTYLQRFNLELPRTTINQIRAGRKIPKGKLQTGDLVFFKTKPRVRHVGIYLDDNKFMHASSSRGVMISSLKNRYWEKRYWFSKHIPELDQL